jgi:hypothetical protein
VLWFTNLFAFTMFGGFGNAGFAHSAFSFAHESLISRTTVAESEVPPGALLTFLQKGLQYIEIETHLQEVRTNLHAAWAVIVSTHCYCRMARNASVMSRFTCLHRIYVVSNL